AGYVSGALFRALIVGFLVWLIATLFSGVFMHNLAVTVSILVMTSVVFALAGFINAVFARSFDDIAIVPTFVLQPMTYLGGVFFSVGLLPGVWEQIAMVNPILYMVNALRYGMLGVTDVSLVLAYFMVVLFGAILAAGALTLLKRGTGLRT